MREFLKLALSVALCAAAGYLVGRGLRFTWMQTITAASSLFLLATWALDHLDITPFTALAHPFVAMPAFTAFVIVLAGAFILGPDAAARAADPEGLLFLPSKAPRLLSGAITFFLAAPYGIAALVEFAPAMRRRNSEA